MGYAAGEMKLNDDIGPCGCASDLHGVVRPAVENTASNLQETARGGQVIVISDEAGPQSCKQLRRTAIVLPTVDPFVAPILYPILV